MVIIRCWRHVCLKDTKVLPAIAPSMSFTSHFFVFLLQSLPRWVPTPHWVNIVVSRLQLTDLRTYNFAWDAWGSVCNNCRSKLLLPIGPSSVHLLSPKHPAHELPSWLHSAKLVYRHIASVWDGAAPSRSSHGRVKLLGTHLHFGAVLFQRTWNSRAFCFHCTTDSYTHPPHKHTHTRGQTVEAVSAGSHFGQAFPHPLWLDNKSIFKSVTTLLFSSAAVETTVCLCWGLWKRGTCADQGPDI